MALLSTSPLHLLSLIVFYVTVTSSAAPFSEHGPQYESDISQGTIAKRVALSVSQGLNSLADKYRESNRVQQMKNAESLLMRLGKRVPTMSLTQELQGLADEYGRQKMESARANLFSLGKRVPVSITQELGPLSSMMREHDVSNAQSMLASLGKRSGFEAINQERVDLIGSEDSDDVKRASLSIGQEMRPLSQLVGGDRHTQKTMNFLQSLGKRSSSMEGEVPTVKRSALSITVPLNALSDMLNAERRKYSLRSTAQEKLNALG